MQGDQLAGVLQGAGLVMAFVVAGVEAV
jgi:hypothetical protein